MRDLFQSAKVKLFDEGGLNELFLHIRNLLMATLIIAAGGYVIRQGPNIELWGVLYDEVAGYIVLAIGVLLAILNALNGWHHLNKEQWHIGIRILIIFLYVIGAARVLQLVVVLRTG